MDVIKTVNKIEKMQTHVDQAMISQQGCE